LCLSVCCAVGSSVCWFVQMDFLLFHQYDGLFFYCRFVVQLVHRFVSLLVCSDGLLDVPSVCPIRRFVVQLA
jgi:hypothetical protein